MSAVRVGLCGWTIGMREYVERFSVVEVQQTFYEPPSRKVMAGWRALAGDGFEFTLKAWQLITHDAHISTYRRLRTVLRDDEKPLCGSFRLNAVTQRAWDTTLECARILKARRVLFQCPPSFKPTSDNLEHMGRFFSSVERAGLTFMWEPRGPWKPQLVATLCAELSLVHVVDPFVSTTVTPGDTYFRLHGIGSHRHVYSPAELEKLRTMLPSSGSAYVMFNNIPREQDAARFQQLLRRQSAA